MDPTTSSDHFPWYESTIPYGISFETGTDTAESVKNENSDDTLIITLSDSHSGWERLNSTESTSSSEELLPAVMLEDHKQYSSKFKRLFSKSYTLSPDFVEEWSKWHLGHASDVLGLRSETAEDLIKQIFAVKRSKRALKKALLAYEEQLGNIGLQSRVITSGHSPKILIFREGILATGSTKACHEAVQFGGKSDSLNLGFKAKAVFSQKNAHSKRADASYLRDMKKAIKFSELLRKDSGFSSSYFMKYHVVTLKSANHGTEKALMAPFCTDGELVDNLDRLNPKKRLFFINQLILAGAAMESLGVIHRDLKPENIMLERNHIVIGDFDFCILKKDSCNKVVGTSGYIPPYPTDGMKLSEVQDRFAIGIILIEIATGGFFNPSCILPTGNLAKFGLASAKKVDLLITSLVLKNEPKNPLVRIIIGLLSVSGSTRITLSDAAKQISKIGERHVRLICPALEY